MSLGLLVSLVLSAPPKAPAPPPVPLPTISAPLGHFGAVVEPAPQRTSDQDRVVLPAIPQCTAQGVFLMRMLGGMSRVLEQQQQWLDLTAGLEKKLFTRKAVLGEVMKHLSAARFEDQKACAAPTLGDGYKLELDQAPKKFCATGERGDGLGEYWFFTGKKPAAVVSVQKGDPDACVLRISAILFDAKGAARLRVHGDWGAQLSATLVADKCRQVDFTFDAARQVFVPEIKSCKR